MAGPLAGVKVVEVAAVVSAPYAAMVLADQGAEVVKIEEPGGGDIVRHLPFAAGGLSSFYANCNRGKRSVVIDLKQPEGGEAVLALVAQADVFIENYRPGVLERLGLGEAAMRAVTPDLIHVSVTGYGPTGPYSDRRVYDPIIQALTGFAATQVNPEVPIPDLVRNIVCDKATALTAAQAISAALFARERGAGGQHIDVPMLDAGLAFFWPDGMMSHTMLSEDATRGSTLAQAYRIQPTADGRLVYFTGGQNQWEGLLRALGREDLLTDPGSDLAARAADLAAAGALVADAFLRWKTSEIMPRLLAEGVPCSSVLSLDEVMEDPQIRHNNMVSIRQHPTAGPVRQARPAARFSATAPDEARLAPLYGEHTDEVLAGLGYDPARIDGLRAAGVIG
jgi:crotonobetainyl-CoA:carnitine CoA-transferase CaiB-like acyl-CoA transferase